MTIGKREKIVISSIVAIIIIALLHLLIFSPKQKQVQSAQATYDTEAGRAGTMKRAPSKKELEDYTSNTMSLTRQLAQGIQQVGLDTPMAFQPPTADPAAPEFLQQLVEKFEEQYRLILDEVQRLRGFAQSQRTRMTFLGPQKWNLPQQLPRQMQDSKLWDQLNAIYDTHELLKSIPADSPLWKQTQANYNALVYQVGMDVQAIDKLNVYGEFVPIINRMAIVDLILRQAPAGQTMMMRDRVVNRESLMDLFDLPRLQMSPPDVSENKSYFVYYSLFFLNTLLELAEGHQIAEVSEVTFWGYAYLRKAPDEPRMPSMEMVTADKLADDRRLAYNAGQAKAATAAVGGDYIDPTTWDEETLQKVIDAGYSPEYVTPFDLMVILGEDPSMLDPAAFGTAPKGPTTAKDTKRDEANDVGFAIPIEIVFTAQNKDGMAYIYDVQKRLPMTEVYRMSMTSLSQNQPDNPYIQFSVTFVFIPQLFGTIENVRNLLRELQPTTATTTIPAGAPPAVPAS